MPQNIASTNKETKEKEITITNIKDVIIDSNTYYYITDSENKNYKVSIKTNKDLLPFINNSLTNALFIVSNGHHTVN